MLRHSELSYCRLVAAAHSPETRSTEHPLPSVGDRVPTRLLFRGNIFQQAALLAWRPSWEQANTRALLNCSSFFYPSCCGFKANCRLVSELRPFADQLGSSGRLFLPCVPSLPQQHPLGGSISPAANSSCCGHSWVRLQNVAAVAICLFCGRNRCSFSSAVLRGASGEGAHRERWH